MKAKIPIDFILSNIKCKMKDSKINATIAYTTKEGDKKSCIITGHITPKGDVSLDITIKDMVYFDSTKMIMVDNVKPINHE
jgi:hypothetical protein